MPKSPFAVIITQNQLAETDSLRPGADNTSDSNFLQRIGRKTDAAATGAVTNTDTIIGYLKQLVTALISGQSALIALVKSVGAAVAASVAGTDWTGTATGSIFIKSVSVQIGTSAATGAITGFWVKSNDTVPIKAPFKDADGALVTQIAQCAPGALLTAEVNAILRTGKKLQGVTTGASLTGGGAGAGGLEIHIEAYAVAEGGALAAA